jgi:hypothetical protein
MVVCLFVCSGCAAASSLFCLISDYVDEGHMAKPWLGWLGGSQKPRGRSSSFITMSIVMHCYGKSIPPCAPLTLGFHLGVVGIFFFNLCVAVRLTKGQFPLVTRIRFLLRLVLWFGLHSAPGGGTSPGLLLPLLVCITGSPRRLTMFLSARISGAFVSFTPR